MEKALVLLAAGDGRRFGGNKLFYPVEGIPMYKRISSQILTLDKEIFSAKILVTQYQDIGRELEKQGFTVIMNHCSHLGISHSIKLAVLEAEKNENLQALCFTVCDQPWLTGKTIEKLICQWEKSKKGMGCTAFSKQTGNPVVFERKYWKELLELRGDKGGKKVIMSHQEDVFYMQVEHEKELWDIDFPLREQGDKDSQIHQIMI